MGNSQTVQGLFTNGALGAQAQAVVDVEDLGAQIQAGLGISPEDVQSSEVTLFSLLVDDSTSIRFGNNSQHIRDGYNGILDALLATKQRDSILVHVPYLNGTILCPYVRIKDAPRMTPQNYNPNGGTPLYDQGVLFLATVAAKAQEFRDNGIPCRGVSCIITDGHDEGSYKCDETDVEKVVRDLLMSESHIISGMGIDDSQKDAQGRIIRKGTDFTAVFKSMGIQDDWILTPDSSPSGIRKAFGMLSQSAVRASQGGKAFSQTAMGGFGTP